MPKQFRQLLGIPMLWWSVRAFHEEDPSTEISLVLHPGFFDDWDLLYAELPEADRRIPVRLVAGGRNRSHSVFNGLMGIEGDGVVAIHDAARPMVSLSIIREGWKSVERDVCAVPAIPVSDSMRRLTPAGSEAVARKDYVAVQTPQVFPLPLIRDAFQLPGALEGKFTDEASLAEAAGYRVRLFDGSPDNLKVTHPQDFILAEALLSK